MTQRPVTLADNVHGYLSLEIDRFDRLYFNGWVPTLRTSGQIAGPLHQRGFPIASRVALGRSVQEFLHAHIHGTGGRQALTEAELAASSRSQCLSLAILLSLFMKHKSIAIVCGPIPPGARYGTFRLRNPAVQMLARVRRKSLPACQFLLELRFPAGAARSPRWERSLVGWPLADRHVPPGGPLGIAGPPSRRVSCPEDVPPSPPA